MLAVYSFYQILLDNQSILNDVDFRLGLLTANQNKEYFYHISFIRGISGVIVAKKEKMLRKNGNLIQIVLLFTSVWGLAGVLCVSRKTDFVVITGLSPCRSP